MPIFYRGHGNTVVVILAGVTALYRRSPPKSTIEDVPRRVLPEPNEQESPAPAVGRRAPRFSPGRRVTGS